MARSIVRVLQDREYRSYGGPFVSPSNFSLEVTTRIDLLHNNMASALESLRKSISIKSWHSIARDVRNLIDKLLNNQNPDLLFQINPAKRQEREMFVLLGGMDVLKCFLEPPLSRVDARSIPPSQIQRDVELWNEVLVMLREVCYAVPSFANHIFSTNNIVFLFTMLSHDFVFENTMNLLEEILAVRADTFSLASVPNLFELINKFSSRRLAHFCRVLALILFEPEDRLIMEGSQVLRSFELLSLRRDRMNKVSSLDIEKNQSVIIEMPNLLPRLVSLLRLANYGPTISELIQHNFAMPATLSPEFLVFMTQSRSQNEWEHFAALETLLFGSRGRKKKRRPRNGSAGEHSDREIVSSGSGVSREVASEPVLYGVGNGTIRAETETCPAVEFPPSLPYSDSCWSSSDSESEMNGQEGLDSAERLRLFGVSTGVPSEADMEQALVNILRGMRSGNYTKEQARNELQFQALALAPHQVELLFVLCTLLSGM
jgi:hypothetical protein